MWNVRKEQIRGPVACRLGQRQLQVHPWARRRLRSLRLCLRHLLHSWWAPPSNPSSWFLGSRVVSIGVLLSSSRHSHMESVLQGARGCVQLDGMRPKLPSRCSCAGCFSFKHTVKLALPMQTGTCTCCSCPMNNSVQGAFGASAERRQDQTQHEEPPVKAFTGPQTPEPLPSMERQGSCPVNGSSPTSIASGAMSARSHVSIRGAPHQDFSAVVGIADAFSPCQP